jgi:uncharacterized protein YggL (DUF469 family)
MAAGILAIVILVTGVVAVASADTAKPGGPAVQGHPGGPGGPAGMINDNLTARAAQILGIDKSKLTDAFKQAAKAMETERTNAMFAAWVSAGKLTQAQADAYKSWMASRPADVPFIFGGSDNATRDSEMMGRLLKDGKLTQAQYDAIKAWLAGKPAVDLPKPEKPANVPANAPSANARPRGLPGLNTEMLDQLLKDGKITQATHDAYKTWLSQKPTAELPAPSGPPQGTPPCDAPTGSR